MFEIAESFEPLSPNQLDAYLQRINLKLPTQAEPTLEVLNQIAHHHANAIPFETGKVLFTKSTSPITTAGVYEEVVVGNRGGYCYFNNILITAALKALGFKVTNGIARVAAYNATSDEFDLGPAQHMLVFVDLEINGCYLVDMGNNRFSSALALKDGTQLACAANETVELRRISKECSTVHSTQWALFSKRAPWAEKAAGSDSNGFVPLYQFSLETWRPADYEALNFYVSNFERHTLRNVFIASLTTETFGRKAMTDMVFRRREGRDHRDLECVVEVKSLNEFAALMKREFDVTVTSAELDGVRQKYFLE
ncbi:hypothetical protein BDR26DRAFT_858737 [Obelidium mucronatum]|nr:hypothetical protein BDR26DRAFT_858737 [Obelidium mucronatum]